MALPFHVLTANVMLRKGLSAAGVTDFEFQRRSEQTNIGDFKTLYNLEPSTLCKVWSELQTTNVPEASILLDLQNRKTDVNDFFLALYWLKRYRTERERKILFHKCERTNRKWANYYARKVGALKASKIVWPDNFDTIFIASVDGVHFRREEPGHDEYKMDPSWYSHKFNKAGIDYEIALCIWTNRVLWINGPFKATANDLSVFKLGLLAKVPPDKKVIADKIYKSQECVSVHNSLDTEEVKHFKARVKARQENFNALLKEWECLQSSFRGNGGMAQHKIMFEACVVLSIFQIENEKPLLQV